MATITINGIRLEVEEHKNVLDCALENGIYIPHLCHHPSLPELGSCRMCIVEVDGEEGVVTSCTLKARDGMQIKTNSEVLNRLRTLALELILAGHPEDCTTCPKYGSCELQTLIQYIGANNARMRTRVKGFKADERNPLLIHDMNRCILCGRCVRVCQDVRGVKVLHYQKKELETFVGTLQGRLLKDEDCRFCGACAEVCPTGTIRDKLQLLTTTEKKEDVLVPCRSACPAHTDVPRYIRFVKEGKYDEAAAVIREKVPFPKALGYICNHVCELHCKREEVNRSMSIRNIKRYAAEHDTGLYWKGKGKQLPDTGRKICVVGGGPAGLTAAYYLRKQGHEVDVKEALPETGGMMRYGIPSYRLPRHIVEEESGFIREAGVRIQTGTRVENPIELIGEYDAVLLAIGSHGGVRLPMEGNGLNGTIVNIDFLRNASMGRETGIGNKVVVLGGGNVAFDCARTARRLGAEEVSLTCLESRDQMTADEEEITQALEEGIRIYPGRTFERITGSNRVTGIDLMEVESFAFDENRRPIIQKKKNSEEHLMGDTIIFAVGQRPDIGEASGVPLIRGSHIQAEGNTTSVPGLFAAGDAVYGTKSVIEAIESGRKAAAAIDIYLGGDGDISEGLAPKMAPNPCIGIIQEFGYMERSSAEIIPAEERCEDFRLVDLGIPDGEIFKEAERCLQCDLRLQISPPRLWGDYSNKKEAAE